MDNNKIHNDQYRLYKAARGRESCFIKVGDDESGQAFRNSAGNIDLLISTWYSAIPDISAPRNYSICFRIVSNNPEAARVSALESIYYIEENYCISAENIEIIYADSGENGVAIGRKAAGNCIKTGQNDGKTSPENGDHVGKKTAAVPDGTENGEIYINIGKRTDQIADGNICPAGRDGDGNRDGGGRVHGGSGIHKTTYNQQNNTEIDCTAGADGSSSSQHNPPADNENKGYQGPKDISSAAEIFLLIHPMVFGGRPTPLMPAINYYLASQMVEDGLTNIEIDSYIRDSYISLPNSINSATDRSVIRLTPKELLYLDGKRIVDLSKQPRPYDSMIMLWEAPEAVEWFTGVLAEFEKEQHRQNELRKLVLKNGWQIPSCIRRLAWADLDKSTAFEACRLISGTYSFLGSNEEEIRYHILRLAKRNGIAGLKEYQKLNAIVTFGAEYPMLAKCQHPLMFRFCPAGGCFIKEFIDEYEKPYLFNDIYGN